VLATNRRYLVDEIDQITDELSGPDRHDRAEARRIYWARGREVFAIKALRILADASG
jgi:hypothetical protein